MSAAAEEQPAESEDDGLNQLLDKVLGSDDEFEEEEEDEEGPSDADLEAVEEEEN